MKILPCIFTIGFFTLPCINQKAAAQLKNPYHIKYNWTTDTTKRTVALDELTLTTQKDEIPTIHYPEFITKTDKKNQYFAHEPVIAIAFNGKAKAYPLSILTLYELANDSIGGHELMITFCPMCNAAMVFNRKVHTPLGDKLMSFGISGLLMHNDMVMYDKETNSWWEQLMGSAIVGEMAGTELKMMPALLVSVKDFFDRYPDGKIMSPEGVKLTGKHHKHKSFYHLDHDKAHLDTAYYLPEKVDPRLPPLERVLDMRLYDHTTVYPFTELAKKKVLNDSWGSQHYVIFFHSETRTVLDEDKIAKSHKVGSATAFYSKINGVQYTFKKHGEYFMDEQTNSIWDITGYCKDGVSKGKQLYIAPHSNHFAFAYLAFYPDCTIYGQ